MTYKEFKDWTMDRCADGCWDLKGAWYCIDIREIIDNYPFWKREKIWREQFESETIEKVINPIENKMKELKIK